VWFGQSDAQVHGYAKAGLACVMIEDQVAPKRCGHTKGKSVVSRAEAVERIRAAVDARDEGGLLGNSELLSMRRTNLHCALISARIVRCFFANYPGADILILARTDARGTDGLDEAIERCKLFRALGADMTFLEAPLSREEMQVSELPRIRHQEFDVLLSLV